jgi:hypothetical protein
MKNFDHYIAIDWSGAKSKGTSSIAVCQARSGDGCPELIMNPYHLRWSRQDVVSYIKKLSLGSEPILLGIDCNFSYSHIIAKKHFPRIERAFELWEKIEGYCSGAENYYAQDFWTDPGIASDFWVKGKKPNNFVNHHRLTEEACQKSEDGNPESPFKLIGAKQVGKGGLSGMLVLNDLRRHLQEKMAIWPFDDLETCQKATIVIVEIYPRIFIKRAGLGQSKIKETRELNRVLNFFRSMPYRVETLDDHQCDALIAAVGMRHLCQTSEPLEPLSRWPDSIQSQLLLEGWIFGVPYKAMKYPDLFSSL